MDKAEKQFDNKKELAEEQKVPKQKGRYPRSKSNENYNNNKQIL